MQILTISRKSTSQFYYENIFKLKTLTEKISTYYQETLS